MSLRSPWIQLTFGCGLALFVADAARAELSIEVGAGVFYTESTLVLLGLTQPANSLFGVHSYWQYNAGGWDGRRETSLMGLARGLEWRLPRTRLRLSSGASYISSTNGRLSSNFEFYEQFLIQRRIADTNVALSYRHWSNANIRQPNLGMDFVGLQVEKTW